MVEASFSDNFVRVDIPAIRMGDKGWLTQSGDRKIAQPTYSMVFVIPEDAESLNDVYKANPDWTTQEWGLENREWAIAKVYVENYLLARRAKRLEIEISTLKSKIV